MNFVQEVDFYKAETLFRAKVDGNEMFWRRMYGVRASSLVHRTLNTLAAGADRERLTASPVIIDNLSSRRPRR